MAILNMAKKLVGQDIHSEIQRASCRAFLALKTVLYFFPADLKDLRLQGHIFIDCLPVWVHSYTPILGREDFSGIIRKGGWLRFKTHCLSTTLISLRRCDIPKAPHPT